VGRGIMSKEKIISLIIVGFLLFICGLVMIFSSVSFGTSSAETWLMNNGGADTSTYQIILKGYINNFLVAGGIIFGLGLMGVILFSFTFLNMKEEISSKI
jgi:hypothetical protein